MIRRLLAWATLLAGLLTSAHAATEMPSRESPVREIAALTFRAPALSSRQSLSLDAPLAKSAAPEELPGGRLRVATVRGLPKAAPIEQWSAIAGGFVARLDAASSGAEGLRVKLDVASLSDAVEVRVQGADGRIEFMTVEPGRAPEAWTPWTEGATQVIELYSRSPQAVSVGAILHFTASPFAKAASTCTVSTMCTTNNVALDAAIAQRKKSIMRINFVSGGSGFVCSANLINTERFPAGYVLTANHCIDEASAARTISSWWFYEHTNCDLLGGINPNNVQLAGGMELVFTNANVDSTLLLMAQSPPSGAMYSGWNATRLTSNTPVVSLSHPDGNTARLALGTTSQELRIIGRPYDMYGVRFSRGIIEGGSSGSGLFQLSSGSLQLVGILSGSTVRNGGSMSCTNLEEEALYGRFEIFQPEIDQYIRTAAQAPDDAPNRVQDVTTTSVDSLDRGTAPAVIAGKRIDYAGDLDTYRFTLSQEATVRVWSESAQDLVGSILDSAGKTLEANDDEAEGDFDFGITKTLAAGTYYVVVGHWEANGTGAYSLNLSKVLGEPLPTTNHTSLWWNAAEPGWGININHQGNILFATLFSYQANGSPMWLVMSNGARQTDGTYQGTLYRTSGPVFNAVPWGTVTPTSVGTMRLSFTTGAGRGTLSYTVDGVSVTKTISKQVFGALPTCIFATASRSLANNFQDLWWNAAEPGWGLNLIQQGNVMFATLFTYDSAGRPTWFVMSNGSRPGLAATFSGDLYRTNGPAFDASPWSPATATSVGTMSLSFGSGTTGTLTYTIDGVQVTKGILRQEFSSPVTLCQ